MTGPPRFPGDPAEGGSPGASEMPTSPATPGVEDDRVAVLAAYLRSNRGKFTEDALGRKAQEAGYTAAEVRAAWSLAADRGTDRPTTDRSRTNRGVVAAVAIAYVVALYLLISGTAAMSSDVSGTVGLIGLIAGVIGWALLRNDRPSLAQGLGCGVVLAVTIPIVVIVVIIGICVVAGTYPSGG